MLNRDVFYREIRGSLFRGRFSQKQVEGINNLLAVWDEHYAGNHPDEFLAASLGTTYHETGATMQPIKERGGPKYFHRMYDIRGARPHKAEELGNRYPGDGAKYAGRGYVQATGRNNARKLSKLISDLLGVTVDFEDNPDLLMVPEYAAHALFLGCITGLYTGRGWSFYIRSSPASLSEYRNSRRVVNGMDRASLIAGYCVAFSEAIATARAAGDVMIGTPVLPAPTTDKPKSSSTTLWSVIGGALSTIGGAVSSVIGLGETQPILAGAVFVMGFMTLGFLAWIFRERIRKMFEDGI